MKAGMTVQRVTCTCMRAGLGVRRKLCTSSQLVWTCKVSFARSSCREIQCIDILVPKIWYHVPHTSNDQNMPKTTSFQRQKRRFLDGFRLGVLRRAAGFLKVPCATWLQYFQTLTAISKLGPSHTCLASLWIYWVHSCIF